MPLHLSGRTWWATLLAIFFVVLAAAIVVWRWPVKLIQTQSSSIDRQRYAALYQAAWRQDEGTSPTLVTATLLVPPTVTALGLDTGRSSTEEQLWQNLKSLTPQQVPIVMTIDSVTGTVSDDDIKASLSLTSDGGPAFSLYNWQPLIAPSRIVNTSGTTSSQIGVAVWQSNRAIDWNTLSSLRFNVANIGGQASRTFSWTEPRLLLQVQ